MKKPELTVDEVGEIFFDDEHVYRAIKDEFIEHAKEMLENGFLNELISKKLFPKTWITEKKIEGFSLVLEHQKIEYWNYPYEWSFDMLKDAALTVLEVNKIANKYGYEIKDGHVDNVVFNMNNPTYIDLGSFIKYDNNEKPNWTSYLDFYLTFYIPLKLWSKGFINLARNIILGRKHFNEQEFFRLNNPILNVCLGNKITASLHYFITRFRRTCLVSKSTVRKYTGSRVIFRNLALIINSTFKGLYSTSNLERRISKIKSPKEHSIWHDYHSNMDVSASDRFVRIRDIINELKDIDVVLEVASNQGKFASFILENSAIQKVIATDYDSGAVNTMYHHNKGNEKLLTLLFDIVLTDGRMYRDIPIAQRISGDAVVALAVTHHLVLTQGIPLDYFFSKIKELSKKYVLVEFMPLGLYHGDMNDIPELPQYYNFEWFKETFENHFNLILEEKLESNRHLFLGSIK